MPSLWGMAKRAASTGVEDAYRPQQVGACHRPLRDSRVRIGPVVGAVP